MKKTAVAQILEASKHGTPETFLEWLTDNAAILLAQEKQQVVDAWIYGNKEGWDMQTDWPEHGIRYYNQTYTEKTPE